jgi:hypothetical protein
LERFAVHPCNHQHARAVRVLGNRGRQPWSFQLTRSSTSETFTE